MTKQADTLEHLVIEATWGMGGNLFPILLDTFIELF